MLDDGRLSRETTSEAFASSSSSPLFFFFSAPVFSFSFLLPGLRLLVAIETIFSLVKASVVELGRRLHGEREIRVRILVEVIFRNKNYYSFSMWILRTPSLKLERELSENRDCVSSLINLAHSYMGGGRIQICVH